MRAAGIIRPPFPPKFRVEKDTVVSTSETAPTRLEDLKPKMRLAGTVKKIELFGAFVDVGVGRDGLVHISALGPQRVNNVTDVVNEGDQVTVWVRKVDTAAGRLDLTMTEPLGVDWGELKSGQTHTGRVTKLEKFGAFVDIGAERPGLVHISELATYRVEDVSEIVKVGDEVTVRVLAVDSRKKQIKLSIKAIELAEPPEDLGDEAEDEGLTPMQLAFKRAQEGAARRERSEREAADDQSTRDEQEAILRRTLANKRQ